MMLNETTQPKCTAGANSGIKPNAIVDQNVVQSVMCRQKLKWYSNQEAQKTHYSL